MDRRSFFSKILQTGVVMVAAPTAFGACDFNRYGDEMNVFQALQRDGRKIEGVFSTDDKGNTQFFITVVDQKLHDPERGLYWIIFVNGEAITRGVEAFRVRSEDRVEARLMRPKQLTA